MGTPWRMAALASLTNRWRGATAQCASCPRGAYVRSTLEAEALSSRCLANGRAVVACGRSSGKGGFDIDMWPAFLDGVAIHLCLFQDLPAATSCLQGPSRTDEVQGQSRS